MKDPLFFFRLSTLLILITLVGLVGCNMPRIGQNVPPTTLVTQAYQTISARLTEAASLTPQPTMPTQPTTIQKTVQGPTSTTPTSTLTLNANTVTPTPICDKAMAGNPIDVTIDDNTPMRPGQSFTKVWNLRNVGACTWTRQYTVELFSGEAMFAPRQVHLDQDVAPGQNVLISVDMVAPQSVGTYQGNWKLRNPSQVWFGIGPGGKAPFWVRIVVIQTTTATATASAPPPTTATSTVTLTPVPLTPTISATPTPEVRVTGQATLIPADKIDLDLNQVNSGSGEDLSYVSNPEGLHLLVPLEKVMLGIYGETQPTVSKCQPVLGDEPIVVETLAQETYLCYQTDQGFNGWAQVLNFNRDTYSLSLKMLTWALP